MKFERLQVPQTTCKTPAIHPRDQDDPHDDAHLEGEKSAKRQKTSEYETYVSEESSSGQDNEQEKGPSTSEIITRRANDFIVSITEPDFKNLNKNDIEDMYLLTMNGTVSNYAETGLLLSLSVFIRSSEIWERVHDFQLGIESYQQKVNLTAPTISFTKVKKHEMFSIIYELVHGIIYKNSKKEKRVMRHLKIHKFCDATPNIILEGLKSYNNDVRYGYNQRDLTKDEKMTPMRRTTRASPAMKITTTPVTNAQLKELIDQGIANALVARDVDRSRNGDDSYNWKTGSRRKK
nr:hypothetical protein [Tanacetum cinerariifolium]